MLCGVAVVARPWLFAVCCLLIVDCCFFVPFLKKHVIVVRCSVCVVRR